uniref:Uncharacterized protein n=1 Tax=Knipowitschia caucasica TaxID=637954 RepID=A0AAV2M507_KNICA
MKPLLYCPHPSPQSQMPSFTLGAEWRACTCLFKPHAVRVVYLFTTCDVTTHPCSVGRGSASRWGKVELRINAARDKQKKGFTTGTLTRAW